jgi:hypothetical protein
MAWLVWQGIGTISWDFLTTGPAPGSLEQGVAGGILPALVGTLIVIVFGMAIAIPLGLGKFGHSRGEGLAQRSHGGGYGGVVDVLADTAVEHEPLAAQLPEACRDARLPHAESLLQFGNGQLLLEQEGKQSEARRIRECPEGLEN